MLKTKMCQEQRGTFQNLVAQRELTCGLDLSNLGILLLIDKGYQGTVALEARFASSNTNLYKIEQSGTFRHRKAEIRPIGGLAFLFVQRFMVDEEAWPSFKNRED
ncbi:hypothetical protein BDK51DRAFT_30908 [Blyttiomyces helicus]|uniref:Uncharacterized protein n=1 Tax=Blyttiomyces helicus TaxID=388810 RepID=A0A4V1IR52_9FUNG|nr:hypothetical protein BDK51DRAFT_30908 [Blyttiomyces helicus]|eukprot:RKO88847.1 hypothetical protein BDK51DRAFT_30908 [Blyttiomyces helicus]